jgi:hypothetical protein
MPFAGSKMTVPIQSFFKDQSEGLPHNLREFTEVRKLSSQGIKE